MTIGNKGYVKHYFMEGERILSNVAGGGHPMVNPEEELEPIKGGNAYNLSENFTNFAGNYFMNANYSSTTCQKSSIDYPVDWSEFPDLRDVYEHAVWSQVPDKLYYFHADHLGSGNIITDRTGGIYQTLAYAPFGESLINLRLGNYDEKYQFTGYEKDEETGLYYANARYYDDGWFKSVDPHAEKYPNISPYAYCANNPIMYNDPTGMDFDPTSEKKAQAAEAALQNQINNIDCEMDANSQSGTDNTDLNARRGELSKSLKDISDMRNDHTKLYRLKNGRIGLTKKTGVDKQGRDIITMYSIYTYKPELSDQELLNRNMPIQLHEIRHGGQIARGEIQGFDEKGNPLENSGYNLDSEVSAYRVQYSWDGIFRYNPSKKNIEEILKNDINKINRTFVENLFEWQGGQQQFLYRGLK
jgi:RHS repeat-associated protein